MSEFFNRGRPPVRPDGASGAAASDPFRVMVVDDSAVIRGLLTRALEGDPEIRVAASVGDGQMAINALQRNAIDVIVLDVEMPVMDGLTAIPKLLAVSPSVKIIMASTLTLRNADISLRALQAGAADYIPKPTTTREISGADVFRNELVAKVKALGANARRAGSRARTDVRTTVLPPVGEDGKTVIPTDGKESLPPVSQFINSQPQNVDPSQVGPPTEYRNTNSRNPLLSTPNPNNVAGPIVSQEAP